MNRQNTKWITDSIAGVQVYTFVISCCGYIYIYSNSQNKHQQTTPCPCKTPFWAPVLMHSALESDPSASGLEEGTRRRQFPGQKPSWKVMEQLEDTVSILKIPEASSMYNLVRLLVHLILVDHPLTFLFDEVCNERLQWHTSVPKSQEAPSQGSRQFETQKSEITSNQTNKCQNIVGLSRKRTSHTSYFLIQESMPSTHSSTAYWVESGLSW